MKKIIITVFISMFLCGLFIYLVNNLAVFDQDEIDYFREKYNLLTSEEFEKFFMDLKNAGLLFQIVKTKNFVSITIVAFMLLVTSFSVIHMFIDKLFFKRFYEDPNILKAFRRGIFFAAFIIIILLLKIFSVLDPLVFVGILILIVGLEFVITKYLTGSNETNNEDKKVKKETLKIKEEKNEI